MKRVEITLISVILVLILVGLIFRSQLIPLPAVVQPINARLPVEWTVRQRSTTSVPGSNDRLRLTIDDITRGQVMVSLANQDGAIVLSPISLGEGDVAEFTFDKAEYLLSLRSLHNELIGEDSARFAVTDAATAIVTEKAKIQRLIAEVESLQGAKFIRNGVEHTPTEAAEHLRSKWKWAGDSIKTAEQFIEQLGTKSSQSGAPYEIRFSNGKVIPAAEFLHEQLQEINKARPATPHQPAAETEIQP